MPCGGAIFWWAFGLASLVAATLAFWPAFRGSSGISQALDQLPSGVVSALGLANFGTPAGYLRGNLYEFFLPLLLAGAAVAFVNGQTAGEEASGRLELWLAQPVDRRSRLPGSGHRRAHRALVLLLVLAVVQLGIDAVVDLRIDAGYLLSTILLCAAARPRSMAALAFAIAGASGPSRRSSWAIGVGLAIAGYLVAALFPLASVLEPWRHISPWDWAFGGDPLEHATDAWRYAALAIPTILLTAVGLIAVARRDVSRGLISAGLADARVPKAFEKAPSRNIAWTRSSNCHGSVTSTSSRPGTVARQWCHDPATLLRNPSFGDPRCKPSCAGWRWAPACLPCSPDRHQASSPRRPTRSLGTCT